MSSHVAPCSLSPGSSVAWRVGQVCVCVCVTEDGGVCTGLDTLIGVCMQMGVCIQEVKH